MIEPSFTIHSPFSGTPPRDSSPMRKTGLEKKSNIWVFDDFLSAQNELMLKSETDAAEDDRILNLNK